MIHSNKRKKNHFYSEEAKKNIDTIPIKDFMFIHLL